MRDLFRRLGADGAVALAFLVLTALAFAHTLSFPARAAQWPHWLLAAFAALNVLLPRYVRNVIFRILMESKVAELAARLKAMSNATDNADKLADELTLQFFRLRQEAITTEILEICSGAEALAASN